MERLSLPCPNFWIASDLRMKMRLLFRRWLRNPRSHARPESDCGCGWTLGRDRG